MRCRLASEAPKMKATLGLTGLTVNAMALIAPGAFLWLTYTEQAAYGAPMAGSDIWFGILAALMLCFATAVSYAELAKKPAPQQPASSYFFARSKPTSEKETTPPSSPESPRIHHWLGERTCTTGSTQASWWA